jgi:hypothetical protein
MPVMDVIEAKEDCESAKYGDKASFAIGLAAAGAASSQICMRPMKAARTIVD